MKKVGLHNLGCKVNSYELDVMQQKLVDSGYEIVPFERKADVYVINTCSVTNIADRKSRQMIHKARALNPDAVIVAAGCYVEGHSIDSLKEDGVDILVGNDKKSQIVELLEEFYNGGIPSVFGKEAVTLRKPSEHTRAFIKVQDGCNCFCSYCIIPYLRGREKSRDIAEIIEEVKGLAASGIKEVVLTGIHLSSYGKDVNDELSLGDLIKEVSLIEGIKRVRLGSLEPQIITEEFISSLADNEKFCPHFHLSLQSGCDSVLKRMNRHYLASDFEHGMQIIRKYFKDPALTTDVIVGFPGESEEEFLETVEFLKRVKFYETHIFKYSRRAGTKADKMDGQLTEKQKSERAAVLAELNKKNKEEYEKLYIGRKVSVLLEEPVEIDGEQYMTGYSKEYIKCNIKTDKKSGEIVEFTI